MLSFTKFFRRRFTIPCDELVAKVRRLENADLLGLLLESEEHRNHLEATLSKYDQVLRAAERRYCQSPDWVTFFREIFGVEGFVRRTFPTLGELTAFERSEQYERIQRLLVKLRERRPSADTESEPTRVITVRIPRSMHESLRTEAHDLRTSMNKLCISKLLQLINEDRVPNDHASNGTSATVLSFTQPNGSPCSSDGHERCSWSSRLRDLFDKNASTEADAILSIGTEDDGNVRLVKVDCKRISPISLSSRMRSS